MSDQTVRELSPKLLEIVADYFKTLSEPQRLKMLFALREREMTVNELVGIVGLSQPNVSRHLSILVRAGLVTRRPRGTSVIYGIADDATFKKCLG